ncbi:hypothetical protein J6590_078729 [Homalodisca vitripennis]|nr:hypothetical protein J6590_078729 [Homalodisca vitripennis]
MTDMEEKYSKENENYLFFKSMAAIVNKLGKKNQAIARSKVFRVVSDLELAKYTAPSSVSTTPSGSSLASWTPAPASFECDQFRDSTSQHLSMVTASLISAVMGSVTLLYCFTGVSLSKHYKHPPFKQFTTGTARRKKSNSNVDILVHFLVCEEQ